MRPQRVPSAFDTRAVKRQEENKNVYLFGGCVCLCLPHASIFTFVLHATPNQNNTVFVGGEGAATKPQTAGDPSPHQ